MRETNHLRKYANEAGKKMRHRSRSKRIVLSMRDADKCAKCHSERFYHEHGYGGGLYPDHDFVEPEVAK